MPLRVLVMTATITPPAGVPGLAQSDPAARLRDYAASLNFHRQFLGSSLDRIVFVENSATDLSPLRDTVSSDGSAIEFLSFNGLDHSPKHGRGYGECKLMDHAMAHSTALLALGDKDTVWKITGRYVLCNLPTMIRRAPGAYDLHCDLKNYPMPWFDMRTYSFTRRGYDRLLRGIYPRLSESDLGHSPEIELHREISAKLPDDRIFPRFRVEPRVDGIRGFDGKRYLSGKQLGKFVFRAATRMFAPNVWI